MKPLAVLVAAFWAMLPAYVPNNAAVLAGGGPPIDGGRTLHGERLLGDGKTWQGTAAGVAAGAVLAVLQNAARPLLDPVVPAALPAPFPPAVLVALPAGAMLGDIVASFLKRRIGRERGASLPGIDQLDFVVVALALTALVAPAWFTATFTLPVLAVVLVITPVLHVTTNVVAYKLSLKSEPW
jgi:CDP-2,3-bis-(O-geranylgeranyl)-sn-glycerol synthase